MVSKGQFVLCLVALDHSKSLTSPFSESHLQKGFGAWSPGLEHDGEDGEDDDLDGGASRVPVRPADSVLQKRDLISQRQEQAGNNLKACSSNVIYC